MFYKSRNRTLYLAGLIVFSLTSFYACQSPSSCGNEVHKVAPKKVAGRGGIKSCGNETHKVKKKKKVRKKDMGLFGKGENPYRRR